MSRREYEVMFKLSGEMSSAFKNSFKNASTEAKLLQSAMRDVNSQMSDVSKYQKQNRAVREAADALQLARAEQERLREELSKLDKITDSNIAQWNKSERAVQAAAEKYLDATAKLKNMQSALEEAGIDTSKTADEAERLKDAYADLEQCKQYITDISSALDDQKAKLQAASSDLAKTAGGFAATAAAAYGLTGEQAKDFETAFAGVQKTVDASAEELQTIREGIIDMSQTDVTATAVEIAAVAESAGQLGIQTENILEFSEVIIDLSESTNLAAEQGASDLAKFANITKMSQDNFDELGSTIVDLGNNFATTEADIVSMGIRLASTGELTGLSEAEIMGMATALSSLGIEAEAGGTAASKLLKKFENAFATGAMEEYASVAGMTEEAFSALYSESNLAAINAFVKGLTDEERNGRGAIEILSDLEIKEERLSNAILALASSDDILTKAVETANEAWEENTALTIEAEKRYATTESRMDMAKNSVENLGIVLGDMMLPLIKEGADDLTEWAMSAQRWVSENQETIKMFADLAVKAGGAVIAFKTMKVAYHTVHAM